MKDILEMLNGSIPFWATIIITVVLSIVEISPLKINPWKNIANFFTRGAKTEKKLDSITSSLEDIDIALSNQSISMSNINKTLEEHGRKIDALNEQIKEQDSKIEESKVISARVRILRFGDEILHHTKHTKEHFEQLLIDIDVYEQYCKSHPNFYNNITKSNISLIKDTYNNCLKGENQFLPYNLKEESDD